MTTVEEDLASIKQRNARVEKDKAWETSHVRIFSICIITYIVAVVTLFAIGGNNIFLSALVPALGFYLSTQSFPFISRVLEKQFND